MLYSTRSPSSTTRIFSSAEKCRRVARRMSQIASSGGCFSGLDFCLIFAPCAYDDPEILPRWKTARCLIGADGGQAVRSKAYRGTPQRRLPRLAQRSLCVRRTVSLLHANLKDDEQSRRQASARRDKDPPTVTPERRVYVADCPDTAARSLSRRFLTSATMLARLGAVAGDPAAKISS